MITFFSFLSKLQLFVQERLDSRVESVGDEDIARALLAACKGAAEPVLNTYDQLLSSGAILPSPNLRLRVLRSVLVVLREWAMSVFAKRMGTSATGASLILGGTFSADQTTVINQGIRDKITSAANRLTYTFFIHFWVSSSLQCMFLFYQRLNEVFLWKVQDWLMVWFKLTSCKCSFVTCMQSLKSFKFLNR